MKTGYRLSLDEMFESSYYYTQYDQCGYGHEIVILKKDKEDFLDAFAKIWRDRAEESLEEIGIRTRKGEIEVRDLE